MPIHFSARVASCIGSVSLSAIMAVNLHEFAGSLSLFLIAGCDSEASHRLSRKLSVQ